MSHPLQNIVIALSFFMLVSACKDRPEGTYRNADIPAELREEIDRLNRVIVASILEQDEAKLRSIMSPDLLSNSGDIMPGFLETASQTVKAREFTLFDEYHHIQNNSPGGVTIVSGTEDSHDYIIQYQALTEESYVAIIEPHRESDRYLITAFYGLIDGGWKLNILQYGRYTIGNLSAPEHYHEALEKRKSGHLVNAIHHMTLAEVCMQPAHEFWQFRIQADLDKLNQDLATEAMAQFPLPMSFPGIPTEPSIFKLAPQRVDDRICTMVKYLTQINIKDTTALAAENNALHQQVPGLFPGITEDVPFIFYRAFNEIPREDITTPYFGFVRKLDDTFIR